MLLLLSLCLENCMFFSFKLIKPKSWWFKKDWYLIILPPYFKRFQVNWIEPLHLQDECNPFHLCQWVKSTTSTQENPPFQSKCPNRNHQAFTKNIETIHPFKHSAKTIHWNLPLMEGNDLKIATLPPDPILSPKTLASWLQKWWSLKAELLTIKKGRKTTNCRGVF